MTLASSAGRSLGALLIGSLAVAAGAASCSNGDARLAPDDGISGASGSGASNGGSSGLPNAAGTGLVGSGGMLGSGGSGGTGGSATGVGGTGTGGTGVGGMSAGGMSAGGSGALAGGGGTASSGGSAGMSSGGSAGTGSTCVDGPPSQGTCQQAVAYGWCGQSWFSGCEASCGTCTSGSGGTSSGGGGSGGMSAGGSGGGGGSSGYPNGGVAPPPNIQGGQQAWGSRYWDCCKPACGWTANVGGRSPAKACDKSNNQIGDVNAKNACESGGSAFACWSDRPWAVGDQLSYGFAAKNDTCGRCFHLQFTGSSHNGGNDPGSASLAGKHMIVQVINNGAIASDQFDLLIPGGGVGLLNACSNQWGTSDLGAQYGGFLAGCNGDKTCVKNKCQQVFAGKQDLLDGCDWFLGWFNAADNPNFTYERIACPAEITQRSGLSDPG